MRDVDRVSGAIVDAAVRLHRRLGPGLLENVYHAVLAKDLRARGLTVESSLRMPFEYEGLHFDTGMRADMLVERCVVVELKSVETLAPVHYKQVLTCIRLLDLEVGLLLNFGAATMKEGLRRIVNNYTP